MRNDGLAFAGLHGRVVDVCWAGWDELLHPASAHNMRKKRRINNHSPLRLFASITATNDDSAGTKRIYSHPVFWVTESPPSYQFAPPPSRLTWM